MSEVTADGDDFAIGARRALSRSELSGLIAATAAAGYRTLGPCVRDGAIVYAPIQSAADLPLGVVDHQDGGLYRLRTDPQFGYFDHVVGPHSLKQFVFPPRETVLSAEKRDGRWRFETPPPAVERVAVFGVRSCDLAALAIQDRVFLHGPAVDPGYQARRGALFLVAVNCRRAAETCFCHSMQTGPVVQSPCDLILTEVDSGFVAQIASQAGGEVLQKTASVPCPAELLQQAREASDRLVRQLESRPAATPAHSAMTLAAAGQPAQTAQPGDFGGSAPQSLQESPPRSLATDGIHDLLFGNLEHPRWEEIATRCLDCANCTLVCPTCFCSSVEEVSDLTGDNVSRVRQWASCFSAEHSYLAGGVVRKSIAARYRQWLTHKLAGWIDQFGVSGCVGCGRCITWCPVGIDLTVEVAAIRSQSARENGRTV